MRADQIQARAVAKVVLVALFYAQRIPTTQPGAEPRPEAS